MNSSHQNNPSENNPSENNPSQDNLRKKGKGRQKVTMAKIENEANLQVTFSKRRAGLFKKASEISTLCGAENAVVVFSPSNKAHSFGSPNVETIANRFANQNPNPTNDTNKVPMSHNNATMNWQNQKLTLVEEQLDLEKKRKQDIKDMEKASNSQNWSQPNTDELNREQLKRLKRSILSFKDKFETKVQNPKSLVPNSYVEGTNPNAGTGGDFLWPTLSGPSAPNSYVDWTNPNAVTEGDFLCPTLSGLSLPNAFVQGANHNPVTEGYISWPTLSGPSAPNSYMQGIYPNVGTEGDFPWPTPSIDFPFNSDFQWPNNDFDSYSKNETMFTSAAPFTLLDGGIDNSNAFAPPNPRANSSSASMFPNPITNSSRVIGAPDPMGGIFGFMDQYPQETSDFNVLLPPGDSNNNVPFSAGPRSTNFVAGNNPGETSNNGDKSGGFTSNYGGGNY